MWGSRVGSQKARSVRGAKLRMQDSQRGIHVFGFPPTRARPTVPRGTGCNGSRGGAAASAIREKGIDAAHEAAGGVPGLQVVG